MGKETDFWDLMTVWKEEKNGKLTTLYVEMSIVHLVIVKQT